MAEREHPATGETVSECAWRLLKMYKTWPEAQEVAKNLRGHSNTAKDFWTDVINFYSMERNWNE